MTRERDSPKAHRIKQGVCCVFIKPSRKTVLGWIIRPLVVLSWQTNCSDENWQQNFVFFCRWIPATVLRLQEHHQGDWQWTGYSIHKILHTKCHGQFWRWRDRKLYECYRSLRADSSHWHVCCSLQCLRQVRQWGVLLVQRWSHRYVKATRCCW